MLEENPVNGQNRITLNFLDPALEKEFRVSYTKIVKIPLRYGIIISIISWFSAIALIYAIIPEKFEWLSTITVLYIGIFFSFIIYATFKVRFERHLHVLGALSNAWAGLYVIFFCDQFPTGVHLVLPALIFIIFFGSYMIRLRWFAGFLAALVYIIGYHIYIQFYSDLSQSQVLLYTFVGWMTLIFAVLAGRVAETNTRIAFIQARTIQSQKQIIEKEKEVLLQEVHHRVKNNLQIIVSLIKLQLSKLENKDVEVALTETQGRILSMSLVHQKINHTSNSASVALLDYTEQLIDNINATLNQNHKDYDLKISQDNVIDIDIAIPLGLIINEMVTNFFKHCNTEDENKHSYSISVQKEANDSLVVSYSDTGNGFPNHILDGPINTLGLELIESLADQIDASFKFFNKGGAVYQLRINL